MATRKTSKTNRAKSPKTSSKLIRIYNRAQYKVVDGDSRNIEPSSMDTRNEDEVLSASKRARLLDLTRNLVRNSSLFNTLLGQLTTNVVSTCGGKVVLSLPNDKSNKELKWAFSKWTRNSDFYTLDNFNRLLKRILREYVIGGDVVLLFDDGLVEDSGKVLMFESSELVDIQPKEVEARYGKGAWMSQGKVYSSNGRNIGVVVSKSQRGVDGFADPSRCYCLKRDPNGCPLDEKWFLFSSNWREGRGVSEAASAIATIHQLEDLVQSELLASRRNAQLFCWLTRGEKPEEFIPSPFGDDEDVSSMSDEEIKNRIEELKNEGAENEKTITFNRARENSIVYELLPDGVTPQQLQTQHPNNNIQTIVDFLANRCAASMGLSKSYATGAPSDADWRSNQLFSFPTILEFQKSLEQVCDWVFNNFVQWAVRRQIVKQYIADDFVDFVDWSWKGIDDLSPVEHQNGIRLALQNRTKTYREILGNDWKEKLEQTAYEHKWMLDHGIVPIDDLMISGGQTDQSKSTTIVEEPKTENEVEEQ